VDAGTNEASTAASSADHDALISGDSWIATVELFAKAAASDE
jgi:hypothetical protein